MVEPTTVVPLQAVLPKKGGAGAQVLKLLRTTIHM